MLRSTLLILSSFLVVDDIPSSAQSELESQSQENISISGCLVTLIESTDVPAQETGTITELNVIKNFWYQDNHKIAQLDDRMAKLAFEAATKQLEASRAEADDDIDVRFYQASLDMAENELRRQKGLLSKGTISSVEFDQTELSVKQADLALERSQKEYRIAQISLAVDTNAVQSSEETVKRHAVFAPHAGNVLEVYHRRGEWVRAGDPIVRIVDMSTLRVTGTVEHGGGKSPGDFIGKKVTVTVSRDGKSFETFAGVVESTDLIQRQDNHFTIVAVVTNRIEKENWILKIEELVNLTVHF